MRIPSNNALHAFFLLSTENPYNARVMMACGLHRIPDRRTFDRRLKNISSDGSDEDLRPRIGAMGRLFVAEELIDPYIASVDSTLLKAKGHVWHRSSMEKGFVYSGTDTDARWGKSKTKGWVFGYKLHIVSSTGSLIVPLSADFTTANIPDSKVYGRVTASLRGVRYVDGDRGYDVDDLYELSRERGFDLVCPIARYENTHQDRVELVFFYESELGQLVYSWRSKSVEASLRADQGRLRDRPSRGERVRQGEGVRPSVGPAVSDDGILQSSDGETAEGAQAHARELTDPTRDNYAHASGY